MSLIKIKEETGKLEWPNAVWLEKLVVKKSA